MNHDVAPTTRRTSHRRGLTLVELLMAIAITTMLGASLAVLSRAVQIGATYSEGQSTVAQHARVALDRIQTNVSGGFANETFPGAVGFADTVSGWRFPDTLVIWRPTTATPANPTGLPLFSELVVYCPNPNVPNQLLEITSRSDTRTVPALTNASGWTSELNTLKTGNVSRKVVLTDLLRTANSSSTGTAMRGAARFEVELRPTASQLSDYRNGTTAWKDVAWAQTWYGDTTGLRQTWVRMEIQLLPNVASGSASAPIDPVPFFGSASLMHLIVK